MDVYAPSSERVQTNLEAAASVSSIEQWRQKPQMHPAPTSEPRLREELQKNLVEFAQLESKEILSQVHGGYGWDGSLFEMLMPKDIINKIAELGAHVDSVRLLRAIIPEWVWMDEYGEHVVCVITQTAGEYPRRNELWDRSKTLEILKHCGMLEADGTKTRKRKLGAKSLQELTAAKALEALQEDDHAVQVLLDLGDAQRQVLLPHLWRDYTRLSQAERARQALQPR